LRAPVTAGQDNGKPQGASPKRDYLRVYYSDYLSQRPVDQEDRPRYADAGETAMESEDLKDWVLQSHPRTRTETYPLYLLTKDLLQRLTEDKCRIIDSRYDALKEQFRQLQELKAHCDMELVKARSDIAERDAQLLLERGKQRHDAGDLGCIAELEASLATLKKELNHAHETTAKLHAIEEEARKHAQKYHKEADAARHALQDALTKLKKAEAMLEARGPADDPLDYWGADKKCLNLRRLLEDDEVVHLQLWESNVIAGLTAAPARGGCAIGVKRKIASRLTTLVYEAEKARDDSTSALSVCTGLIEREPPLNVYDLIQESILKDVKLAPVQQQAALVAFLGSQWMSEFESARGSVDRVAETFAQKWGCEASADKKISREELVHGLDELGITEVGAGRFLRAAVGDRWLSLKLQSQALRSLAGASAQLDAATDHTNPYLADSVNLNHAEDHIRITVDDIRRALHAGGPYHSLVDKDVRYEELSRIIKHTIDHELGGHGLGAFLESHHAREDDHKQGYAVNG